MKDTVLAPYSVAVAPKYLPVRNDRGGSLCWDNPAMVIFSDGTRAESAFYEAMQGKFLYFKMPSRKWRKVNMDLSDKWEIDVPHGFGIDFRVNPFSK